MANKIMTNAKFCNFLKKAESRTDTKYNNRYPYNLGYYDGWQISWDCWNLWKSIIWSKGACVTNYTKGKYYGIGSEVAPKSGLGDWDDNRLYAECYDKSTNFDSLTPGEPLFVDLSKDHSGVYVGSFTDKTGLTCNVVECTVAWGRNCVTGSWVDPDGTRRRSRGGAVAANAWKYHGKLPYIDYIEEKEEGFDVSLIKDVELGSSGGRVLSLQSMLNTKNNAGLYLDGQCGVKTVRAIKDWQTKRGLYVDGVCGPKTWLDLIIG